MTVGHVADEEHLVDRFSLEDAERGSQALVLRVDVADQPEFHTASLTLAISKSSQQRMGTRITSPHEGTR